MDKPNSLREHLLAAVPDLKRNPDRLLMFIDAGKVR
ncbi:phage tail protein, partial [Pseudomonas inefficax]